METIIDLFDALDDHEFLLPERAFGEIEALIENSELRTVEQVLKAIEKAQDAVRSENH
jgi:hypothetical protein